MEIIPTDRELEALKVLWRKGEATVREIYDEINAGGGKLAYTTVLSLLQVMEQKGLAGHRKAGKTYVHFAKIEAKQRFAHLPPASCSGCSTGPWTSTWSTPCSRGGPASKNWIGWNR